MIVRDRFDPQSKWRCAMKVRDEMLLMAFGWQNERISPQTTAEEEVLLEFDALGKGTYSSCFLLDSWMWCCFAITC